LAEQHLLASGKRDAANLLAEVMFEWYVPMTRYDEILMVRRGKGAQDPGPYAAKGVLPYVSSAI